MYKLLYFRCLFLDCPINKKKIQSTRDEFWHGHVEKKSTDVVMEYLKDIGLVMPFGISLNILGRRTILNIFTDLCREPYASKIIDGVNDDV